MFKTSTEVPWVHYIKIYTQTIIISIESQPKKVVVIISIAVVVVFVIIET